MLLILEAFDAMTAQSLLLRGLRDWALAQHSLIILLVRSLLCTVSAGLATDGPFPAMLTLNR